MPPALFASDDDGHPMSAINTTPLVDIMLVLLIIFLITVPVVVHTVPLTLPREVDQPSRTLPHTVVIAVDKTGDVYWNEGRVAAGSLYTRLAERAGEEPQPEVQIRADRDTRYEFIGRVVAACQRAGIEKVAFITEPDAARLASP